MIEPIVTAVIACVTGGIILNNKIHTRHMELDRRIDQLGTERKLKYIKRTKLRYIRSKFLK